MNFNGDGGYLTLREAAEIVKINYFTLRRRILRRKLNVKRRGRMIFIRRRDVVMLRGDK